MLLVNVGTFAHSSHKYPWARDPVVRTPDGDLIVRAPGSTSSASLPPLWGVLLSRGLIYGSRAWFSSGTPILNFRHQSAGRLGPVPGSLWGFVVLHGALSLRSVPFGSGGVERSLCRVRAGQEWHGMRATSEADTAHKGDHGGKPG